MNAYKLEPVWSGILTCYAQFKSICEKHGLRYFASGGTALGTVRHRGFIPWDDDLDVFMPRPDYMRFVEIANRELPPTMKFIYIGNHEDYNNWFGKIMYRDPSAIANIETESGLKLPQGVFVDIFPLDGVPNNRITFWLRGLKFVLAAASYRNHTKSSTSSLKRFIATILSCVNRVVGNADIKSAREYALFVEKSIAEIPYDSSERCATGYTYVSHRFGTYPFPRKWIGVGRVEKFENTEMRIPEMCEEFLTFHFGDYMTPPPLAKRCVPCHDNEPVAPWRIG